MTPDTINRLRIRAVAQRLAPLAIPVVFIGGATVSLYVSEGAASQTRPTADVDVLVEILTYGDYARLEESLRSLGFVNDATSAVLCRYKAPGLTVDVLGNIPPDISQSLTRGIVVDIMPTSDEVIGFSNRWYPEGFQHALEIQLDEATAIKIFSLPYFIASKLEAFNGRGGSDLYASHDLEDIIFVLDNAPNVEVDLKGGSDAVQTYLKIEFAALLNHPDWNYALEGHIIGRFAAQRGSRITKILQSAIER